MNLLFNYLSLTLYQVSNYVVPLLLVPFLSRTLGAHVYGEVMVVQSAMLFCFVVVDFGFNQVAARNIALSVSRQDRDTYVSAVMMIKLILLLCCAVSVLALSWVVPVFSSHVMLTWLSFPMVMGYCFFNVWFFQALEKSWVIVLCVLMGRFLFRLPLFLVVREASDFCWVPIFVSLGYCVSACISIVFMFRCGFVFRVPPLGLLRSTFAKMFPVFVGNISTSVYTVLNTVLMGMYAPPSVTGLFIALEKVFRGGVGLLSAVNMAILPRISKQYAADQQQGTRLLWGILLLAPLVSACAFAVALLAKAPILVLLFGASGKDAVDPVLYRLAASIIFVVPVSAVLFQLLLIVQKKERYFGPIFLVAAGASIGSIFLLFSLKVDHTRLFPMAMIFSEIFVLMAGCFLFVRKAKQGVSPKQSVLHKRTGSAV